MKKSLLAALAATVAFTACTNEELIQQIAVPGVEGDMVTLSENFAIGATRGEDATTRAQYENNGAITWTPQLVESEPVINKVGFAWKGQAVDGKVYTNYMFEHFAFESSIATPVVDKCVGWKNLVFLSEEDFNTYGNGNSDDNDYVKSWTKDGNGNLTTFTTANGKTAVPSKAFFKTENLTIFGGDYVAYMPYDPSFINAGYLYAKAPSVFESMNVGGKNETAKILEHLADYHFYAAHVNGIQGGTTANGFNLKAVTGNVILKFVNTVKDDNTRWQNITKVAIYSADKIVVEQALDITAANFSLLPAEKAEVKKSSSLMANLSESYNFTGNANGDATYYVAMAALPQTITNATVVLFAMDGSSCSFNCGNINVKSNEGTTVTVNMTDANKLQTEMYYVVDMETFQSAMTSAAHAGTGVNKKATLQLINDIVFDKAYTTSKDGKVWINRDMDIKGGNITVPAGQFLQLGLMRDEVNVTIDGEITIEDACCGVDAAEVSVIGYDNTPSTDKESTIEFKQAVSIEEGAKLTIGNDAAYVNAKFVGDVTNGNVLNVLGDATVEFGKLANNKTLVLENASASSNNNHVIAAELTNAANATVTVNKMTTLTATTLVNNGELSIANSGTGKDGNDGTVNIQSALTNNGLIENYGVYNSNGTTTLKNKSTFVDYVGSQYGNKMPTCETGYKYICEVNTSDKTDGDRLAYALNAKMPTTTVRFVSDKEHTYELTEYAAYDKLAEVDYVIVVEDADFNFNNNGEESIRLGGDITVEDCGMLTFNNTAKSSIVVSNDLTVNKAARVRFIKGATSIEGNLNVTAGEVLNAGGATYGATVNVDGNVTFKESLLIVKALGTTAANEATTKSWTIGGNLVLDTDATMTVAEKAALSCLGNLTIAKNASATFAYSSYSEFAGTIVNNGTFNRVLSSSHSNANPALVWCSGYTNNGTQVNGAAQVANK